MNRERLQRALPPNAQLVLGDMQETVPAWLAGRDGSTPIGFVSLDVDYYSSSKDALEVFAGAPELYLPRTVVFLDDIEHPSHNSACGELLAVREFNDVQQVRRIEHHPFLRSTRCSSDRRGSATCSRFTSSTILTGRSWNGAGRRRAC